MSSGITGDRETLNRVIREMQALDDLMETVAKKSAPRIQALCRANYAAGKGSDGAVWPRNKDGSISLQRPAALVTFRAEGSTIVGSGEDVLKYHTRRRPVFPGDGDTPPEWQAIIDEEAANELRKVK